MIERRCSFLGRHDREAVGEIEAHLVSEDGARAGAGAVTAIAAGLQHMAKES